MPDFIAAFNDGINAAKKVEEALREITAVFNEVNRQLAEATVGKIQLARRRLEVQKSTLEKLASLRVFPPQLETYMAIVAINNHISNKPMKELAKWSMNNEGYPCTIDYDDEEVFCGDREALEEGLAQLLATSSVGRKIIALLEMQEPEAVEKSE